MQCTITGELTNDPVLSPKSNMVFDRKVLETYLAKHGKDPVSNEPLSTDEVIPVKTMDNKQVVLTTPPRFNSIPSLLTIFQNEWDAIVLENFELKKKINLLQKDLANSVYHYDASIRVISRLSKERDEAVRKLNETLISVNKIGNQDVISKLDNQEVSSKIDNQEIFSKNDNQKAMNKIDNQLKPELEQDSINLKEPEAMEIDEQLEEIDLLQPIKEADKFLNTIHQKQLKENKSLLNTARHHLHVKTLFPFTTFDNLLVPVSNRLIQSSVIFNNELLLLSNKVHIFVLNLSMNSLINKFKISDFKKNTGLVCLNFINISDISNPNFKPLIGFDDGSAYVIDTDLSKKEVGTVGKARLIELPAQESVASIVSLLSHPSLNSYLVRVYSNGIWALVDCHGNKTLFVSTLDASANFEYSTADLHMDGSLLAIGTTNGLILIYDLKTGDKLTTFQESESDPTKDDSVINNLVYANNGYWLLSTLTSFKAHASKINIWDLRKGQISTTINSNKIIRKIAIDKFSQILTILFADNTVEFFKYLKKTKQWERDQSLSESFKEFFQSELANKSTDIVNIFWQKTFDRTFYVVQSDGKWSKFAIDFE